MIDPVHFRFVSDEQQLPKRSSARHWAEDRAETRASDMKIDHETSTSTAEPDRRTAFGDPRRFSRRDVDDEDVRP
jgi:hypothetical protein